MGEVISSLLPNNHECLSVLAWEELYLSDVDRAYLPRLSDEEQVRYQRAVKGVACCCGHTVATGRV